MRFGIVHRVMTDALAVLGILAVVSTASMSPAANLVVLLGVLGAIAIPERWQTKGWLRQTATLGPLTLFVVQIARLVLGRPPLDVAVEFAALLQVFRIATRRGAAHDQQIIVLALLHFVAGTVLGGGLAYGLCFFGFLVVAPGALVLSHLRREVEGNYRQGARDRTGLPVDVPRILRSRRVVGRGFLAATCLLSLPIFLFTALLFVLFPRVGLSLLLLNHPHSGRMVGFSDRVDLGEVGVLRTDPSLALRFTVTELPDPPPPRLTLRLRGTAFDAYNGRAWSRTQERRQDRADANDGAILFRPATASDRKITIDLEPIDPPVLFVPPRTVSLQAKLPNQSVLSDPFRLVRGPEGEVRYAGGDVHGLRYEAYLAQDREVLAESLGVTDRARYTSLTRTLPARIGELAHAWADDQPTQFAKAHAIEEHLKKDFRYDTGSPSGGTPQPLDHFLFESRRGHCEFFSTAMAMMLRELHIPSRNVTGFVGGTYNRFGRYYAVREGDAHSWVEAYIDDAHGWVTFDPTPTAAAQPLEETTGAYVYLRDVVEALSQRWNRYVLGYDLRTQMHLFEDVGRRYDQVRRSAGVDRGFAEKLTRGPVLACAAIVLAFVAYTLWKRRAAKRATPRDPETTAMPRALLAAAELYRSLDQAVALQGFPRPTGLPPLRHAATVAEAEHPLADEILALTNAYLDVRFGGSELTEERKKDFERRVRGIRAFKAPPAATPSAP